MVSGSVVTAFCKELVHMFKYVVEWFKIHRKRRALVEALNAISCCKVKITRQGEVVVAR